MKTKKILVEMPADWEEQLSTMNDASIGTTLYEILGRSPLVEFSEDAISRQAAIDAIDKYDFDFPQYMERFVTELRDAMKADLKADIKDLPSVTPKQRTGHWIDEGRCAVGSNAHAYICSECGGYIVDYDPYDFCKFCGAKMEEQA